MVQYRNGIINSTGAATTLMLGFVPDRITVLNYTTTAAQTGVGYSEWIKNVVPSAEALITTYTAGAPVVSLLTSNGITPVVLGGDWQATEYTISTITNANPCVVTVVSAQPTNALALVNGMTLTFSGVVGMTQLNTNRYTVAQLSGTSFAIYDLFGHPVDSTAFGTYVNTANYPGYANQISYPATASVVNATTGAVITPGQPAGNQYDIGYAGVILGTGVVGASTNVLYYEAFYSTPTGW